MEEVEFLYRKWVSELWNDGDLQIVDEMFDPDGIASYPYFLVGDEPIRGIGNYKKFLQLMRASYRDFKVEILELSADGETVTSLVQVNAVPRQSDEDSRDMDLSINSRVLSRTVFKDGKIKEIWNNMQIFRKGRPSNLLEFENS